MGKENDYSDGLVDLEFRFRGDPALWESRELTMLLPDRDYHSDHHFAQLITVRFSAPYRTGKVFIPWHSSNK
jgi:hypothetical protein